MKTGRTPLECWGGIECTVVRIGESYLDQVKRSGHHDRVSDLDLIAGLGLTAIRYPVVWERTAPDGLETADWQWTDERLTRLRALGVRPIAGLLHHGSGPRAVNLLHPDFPAEFERYAAAVADRYPWIEDYTPINEPLTTARFSALYGFWYPHARDDRSFVVALLRQMRATVLAMRAIRRVNPRARLVQTEDAGRTFSTEPIAAQAAFENHRRWLTFDFLTGRVVPGHPLHEWLLAIGTPPSELEWLAINTCPPDILGLNYYLTSDRFIDHRVCLYPPECRGGNGRDEYADVEAVRAYAPGIAGHRRVLEDTWLRYRLPVAISEVHAGCTREEQLRWLAEAWSGAERARARGADVRAVTVWSLFGAFGWDTLLTRPSNAYEPGAFDVRSTPPRPTAIARLTSALSAGTAPPPVAIEPGWWRRPTRLTFARAHVTPQSAPARYGHSDTRILITGVQGTLGRCLLSTCERRGLNVVGFSRRQLDITNPWHVFELVSTERPWAVINAAGYVNVDGAEGDAERCMRINARAPAILAAACRRAGARLVTFSSDLVFDGRKQREYTEEDEPAPLNVYGVSKLEAERAVLRTWPSSLVIRTSAFFGPEDDFNFVTIVLRALLRGERVRAANDTVVSPTYVPDLAGAVIDLLVDGASGVWHLANTGAVSWSDLARAGARAAGLDDSLVEPVPTAELMYRAPRPSYSALSSARGSLMPHLDDALNRYVCASSWRRAAGPAMSRAGSG